jgi:hypothetical protein
MITVQSTVIEVANWAFAPELTGDLTIWTGMDGEL